MDSQYAFVTRDVLLRAFSLGEYFTRSYNITGDISEKFFSWLFECFRLDPQGGRGKGNETILAMKKLRSSAKLFANERLRLIKYICGN